jgi:hypothetical protein
MFMTVAPFLLTNLLLEASVLHAPARVVNVASVAHAFGSLDLENDFNCTKMSSEFQVDFVFSLSSLVLSSVFIQVKLYCVFFLALWNNQTHEYFIQFRAQSPISS